MQPGENWSNFLHLALHHDIYNIMTNKAAMKPLDFWAKVLVTTPDECWLWPRAKSPKGYGATHYKHELWRTHRLAYYLTYGMHVCHTCDNPPCCNPKHLFLGTNADNTADKVTKGRTSRVNGTANGANKLTEEQVKNIRIEYVPGLVGHKRLAKKYGVSQTTIKDILTRKIWKWL